MLAERGELLAHDALVVVLAEDQHVGIGRDARARLPDRHAPVGGMLKFGANLVATQFVGYIANNARSPVASGCTNSSLAAVPWIITAPESGLSRPIRV